MNIISMLKPKYSTTYLQSDDTLRDGLNIMRESGYSAVPVIDQEGKYVGIVSEGDFLWNILDNDEDIIDSCVINDILHNERSKATTDGTSEEELINLAMQQNFVPMVDDRDCYIGIITRRDIIQNILQKKVDSRYILLPSDVEIVK